MNRLVVKEIRLLLPAFLIALLLAVVPIYFFVDDLKFSPDKKIVLPVYLALAFGVLMLGLSSFGREFSMNTFAMMLAQPLNRALLWWTKIAVLSCATVIVFCLFYLACMLARFVATGQFLWHIEYGERATLALVGMTLLAILAGGLWATLLLRQIMGAFWFALLIPIALWTLILWNGGNAFMVGIALAIYSVAGFWWAWRQFIRAQEVAWTGGEVNLPEWRSATAGTRSAGRTYRPLVAMLRKELKLYQVALAGMAGLFIVHLGVIALRKMLHNSTESSLVAALSEFGGLWFLVPVVTGSLNVADERRLGTMEAQLCLPVSLRVQFVIKLCVVLLLSGFLSALLLWAAEGIGNAVGAGSGFGGIKMSYGGKELATISAMFLGLTLVVFYASTLARSILHAIATAVLTVFAFMFLWGSAAGIRWATGINFCEGPLLEFITVPTMVVTVIWLAYGNYRRLSESRRLWWRNARGLVGAMLFAMVMTTLIFHRSWEFLTPLEPAHGSPKLNLAQSLQMKFGWNTISVAFPDGRLWWQRLGYMQPRSFSPFGENLEITLGRGGWVGSSGNHFLEGSNWVQLIHSYDAEVGIRTDGTLWISEKQSRPFQVRNGSLIPLPAARLIQFGKDGDWKSVTREGTYAVMLLKTDGTLWHWGTDREKDWRGSLTQYEPRRLGKDSDWVEFFPSPHELFIRKADGTTWSFVWPEKERQYAQIILDENLALKRKENFYTNQWRSFAGNGQMPLAVRADGTLWTFGGVPYNSYEQDNLSKSPMQIGTETNWVSVVGDSELMFALKADGTLWKWDRQIWNSSSTPYVQPPVRVGTHSDWVALGGAGGSIWSLSADGNLWNWWHIEGRKWLMASRKPDKIANLFEP